MSLPLLFVNRGQTSPWLPPLLFSLSFWLFIGVYALVFYLNYHLLILRFYFRKQYLAYGLAFGFGLLLMVWLQPFDRLIIQNDKGYMQRNAGALPPPPRFQEPRPGPPQRMVTFDIVSIMLFVMVWVLGLALRITQQGMQAERRAIQAEADKAQAELMSLKAQINPHFLFNTLNTIYTMAQLNHPACAESIMKLSNIMRYVSDEVMDDLVPLEDEIACIRQYIELQQLRLNRKTRVDFEANEQGNTQMIPPLILMTLVENIFKHGVSSHEASTIEIRIAAEEGKVSFYSRNKKFASSALETRAGTGLENVRKRLAHMYPGHHQLDIEPSGDYFMVNLILYS